VASGVGDDFTAAVDQLVDRLGKILRRRRSQVRDHHAGPVSEGLTSA
jgi:ribosome-associated translation inhibitor RaiA